MRQEFAQYNNATKLSFILSGLQSDYTPEWEPIYVNTLKLVNSMYELRKELYDALDNAQQRPDN